MACALLVAPPAGAARLPPTIGALTAPLAEDDAGGRGCLTGIAVSGIALLALAGGPGVVAVALAGPLAAAELVQGGVALAFLGSSACYVGQATSPVATLGWSSLAAWLGTARPAGAPPLPGTGGAAGAVAERAAAPAPAH